MRQSVIVAMKARLVLLAVFLALTRLSFAEESSILERARLAKGGDNSQSDSSNALIDNNYLTVWHDSKSDEFSVIFDQPYKIMSFFVQGRNGDLPY